MENEKIKKKLKKCVDKLKGCVYNKINKKQEMSLRGCQRERGVLYEVYDWL